MSNTRILRFWNSLTKYKVVEEFVNFAKLCGHFRPATFKSLIPDVRLYVDTLP